MNDWKHIYQRISEHENSKRHNNSVVSYFNLSGSKNLDVLLFEKQESLRKNKIKNNVEIINIVINIVKMFGKRGLSFRGKHENILSLENINLDHGNFFRNFVIT